MMFWGCLRFEMNVHKPFFLCGHSFQNELGFQRDSSSFGPGFPIGAGSDLLAGESKGDTLPWQWFPKTAVPPWREASNGGQRPPWQEESNETGGFVAHDLARKV